MSVLELIHLCSGSLIIFLLILFIKDTIVERHPRAIFVSILSLFVFIPTWYLLVDYSIYANTSLIFLAGLFFLPLSKEKVITEIPDQRIDERDTMFARASYKEGSKEYDEYYEKHPEHKIMDDSIKKLPHLCSPGGKYYDPLRSKVVESMFMLEGENASLGDGEVSEKVKTFDKGEITRYIKKQLEDMGAKEVGICQLDEKFVYSHVGKGSEEWGKEITQIHKYAIVYTVEMNYKKVKEAPKIGTTEETANQYLNCQKMSISLAEYIRSMGYPARAHMSGSNYHVILPPIAQQAGLGEVGRNGYLLSKKYGARVRLGCITTDLELDTDTAESIGAQAFCSICKKCATNCPSKSIPLGEKEISNGVEKWPTEIESCYKYWRIIGTDCAICMKVCPYSHPNTFMHNLVRLGIRNSQIARYIFNLADDIFYGKNLKD